MMTRKDTRLLERSHQRAMALCDEALLARSRNDNSQALVLFEKALASERAAAEMAAAINDFEPTRSVLLRSAASLALECGQNRVAEQLIGRALSGEPPDEIADELRDLLEQANFLRHLELRGVSLSPTEFQMTIGGRATGAGMAPSDEFFERVQASEKLIVRTFERNAGLPFRKSGRAPQERTRNCELYLSVPRIGSFSVTLRLGLPERQLFLPGIDKQLIDEPEKVIDDLFECLNTFGDYDEDRLVELIPNESYRQNFIGLASKLMPDGDQIKVVGLTAVRQGEEKRVVLLKHQREIRANKAPSDKSAEATGSVTGRLLFANGTASRSSIKVVDSAESRHTLIVPEWMMEDIVRPLWGAWVMATYVKRGSHLHLTHIGKKATQGNVPD
jgi:hypothetical protein